jgi:hypothetical protein
MTETQLPSSVKKLTVSSVRGHGRIIINVPDGIITHLTRECGGNVHNRNVVDVTCGSFEKETHGANPQSGHMITVPSRLRRMPLI